MRENKILFWMILNDFLYMYMSRIMQKGSLGMLG